MVWRNWKAINYQVIGVNFSPLHAIQDRLMSTGETTGTSLQESLWFDQAEVQSHSFKNEKSILFNKEQQ